MSTSPLPVHTQHGADPLRAVLGAAGDLAGSETAAVQILARPLTGRRPRAGRSISARGRLLDLDWHDGLGAAG